MKDIIMKFLKNKFNIALIVIQIVALVCYFLSGLWKFFPILFFMLEGAFFIVWGIKIFVGIRASDTSQEIYNQLPFSEEEKKNISKTNLRTKKNNKMVGIILIILGSILFFSIFSVF